MELPPLPEMSQIDKHLPTGIVIRGYNAADMRAYAAACVERERERIRDEFRRRHSQYQMHHNYYACLAREMDDGLL